MFNLFWMYALIILALIALYYFQDNSVEKEVPWTKFEQTAEAGQIKRIVVLSENGEAEGELTPEGAKAIGLKDTDGAVAKIKANIPSPDKIQDKIDSWNADLLSQKNRK